VTGASGSGPSIGVESPTFNGNAMSVFGAPNITTGSKNASVYICYKTNCPSIPTSAGLTLSCNLTSGTAASVVIEFDLYEFSGISHSSGNDVESQGYEASQGSIPQSAVLSPTQNDLILCAYNAPAGSAVSVGSGFTAGISPSLSVGGFQYKLGAGPGSVSTAFGNGVSGNWGASGLAFKSLASNLSVSPTSITAINKLWGFSPNCNAQYPTIQTFTVTTTGSWTAVSNESWAIVKVLNATQFSVSIFDTAINNTGYAGRVHNGTYNATITVTEGSSNISVPVVYEVGYADNLDSDFPFNPLIIGYIPN
jgi:hypothetical protein